MNKYKKKEKTYQKDALNSVRLSSWDVHAFVNKIVRAQVDSEHVANGGIEEVGLNVYRVAGLVEEHVIVLENAVARCQNVASVNESSAASVSNAGHNRSAVQMNDGLVISRNKSSRRPTVRHCRLSAHNFLVLSIILYATFYARRDDMAWEKWHFEYSNK